MIVVLLLLKLVGQLVELPPGTVRHCVVLVTDVSSAAMSAGRMMPARAVVSFMLLETSAEMESGDCGRRRCSGTSSTRTNDGATAHRSRLQEATSMPTLICQGCRCSINLRYRGEADLLQGDCDYSPSLVEACPVVAPRRCRSCWCMLT